MSMSFQCESCGADLFLKKGESSVKCGFCGHTNKPSEESQEPGSKQRNLMINAVESDNWDEVSKYATQILEEDPSDYEAWFYKGAAAGWTSKHIDDPSKEISNCFKNAFANAEDDVLEEVIDMFAVRGTVLLLALARGSRNFAQQHGYLSVGDITIDSWQEDVMNGHISKIFGFIDTAYLLTDINRNDRVTRLNPAIDALFLKLYAFLYTKVGFEGTITAKNPFNLTAATFTFVYDEMSELGIKWVPRVEEILEAHQNNAYSQEDLDTYMIDEYSDFSDPREGDSEEAAAAGGGCFIATAIYGESDHFNLLVLRSFRDNTLRSFNIGKKFIAFYYIFGPKLALRVRESKFLINLFKPSIDLIVKLIKFSRLG